jgi:hypothetical protein
MKLRLIGIMLVAAISLTAASTASATSWFSLSKAGTVILKQEGNQELAVNGKKIVCEAISASTFVPGTGVILVQTILALVTYSGTCEAFGVAAKITVGEILFDANGSIRIGNTDKFVISPNGAKCSVQILTENETTAPLVALLGTIKYTNVAAGVQGEAKGVEVPVVVRGSGTLCGTSGTSKGTYTGNGVTELVGGHISVE